MDSFLEEKNLDQKGPEIETYKFAQNVSCTYLMQLWNLKSSKCLVIERLEVNLLKSAHYY